MPTPSRPAPGCYRVRPELSPSQYTALMDAAEIAGCDYATLVIRHPLRRSDHLGLLARLGPDLHARVPVADWPGTCHTEETEPGPVCADVLLLRLTPAVWRVLQGARRIEEWCGPERPEDLALYRGRELWLASTAHEGLCHLLQDPSPAAEFPATRLEESEGRAMRTFLTRGAQAVWRAIGERGPRSAALARRG